MKLVIPQNIYSALFAFGLSDDIKSETIVKPSSLITADLKNGKADIGLIPSLDLNKHNELFISGKFAISFDGALSNSFLYFKPNQNSFSELYLKGDVASNDIILSKIFFSEQFNSDLTIHLDTNPLKLAEKNYLISGNENLDENLLDKGISFADEIASMIDFPYVNFVLASNYEEPIKEFNQILGSLDEKIESKLEVMLSKLNLGDKLCSFIDENFNSVYFDLTENEIGGLEELLRLPYYKGVFEELFDLKLVK
ncbi:MAG: hypothetical protein V1720_02460 [bacterium]